MKKKLFYLLGIFACVVLLVAFWVHSKINGSLPILDGTVIVAVQQEVTINRDNMGVPTIAAQSRADAAFALGFLHAQDRFFQMDLMRRMSAGRLAELIGEPALQSDIGFRKHDFEATAANVLRAASQEHRAILDAYTQGVNTGLSELDTPPFEYLLLRTEPTPWKVEDCALVVYAILCDLQDENGNWERWNGEAKRNLPEAVYDFLFRFGTSMWDAPLVGGPLPDPEIPDATEWSFPQAKADQPAEKVAAEPVTAGSNNWAVDGNHTSDGRAILANDMHLGLRVPCIWYRAKLECPAFGTDRRVELVGPTLPGVPAIVVGSNGSVAWGLTNAAADFGDLIELEWIGENTYATPDGPASVTFKDHEINVQGGENLKQSYPWTKWGPVVHGGKNAYRWVGYDVEAINFALLELEAAMTTEQALKVAQDCGVAHTNFVCADSKGSIGWTIAGRIPKRVSPPPQTPTSWSQKELWVDYLNPNDYPQIVDPEDGVLFTANQRVVDEDGLKVLGIGQYALGARAGRIRDRLLEKDVFTEKDMLDIQLDDVSPLHLQWRDLLIEIANGDPDLLNDEQKQLVTEWDGHTAADSLAYPLIKAFRERVISMVWTGIAEPYAIDGGYRVSQLEGVVWQLVTERPAHISPHGKSWTDLLHTALDLAVAEIAKAPRTTWGTRNQTSIQHPLSQAIPRLSKWLDMPPQELPGDWAVPRVQRPKFGASERMVVSPGHEEDGIYHMPGGQSGHPRSPFYRRGFEDWAEGRASSLLPGPAVHKLVLKPNP